MSQTWTVVNPATAQPIGEVAMTSLEQTDAAIERAHEARTAWRAVAPGERARLLRRFGDVVDAHLEELAELEVRNAGHTSANARWEAGNVRDCLHYYAGAPERLHRPADPRRRRRGPDLPRAARRRGDHRALELPDADAGLGDRARAGRRQLRRRSSPPS